MMSFTSDETTRTAFPIFDMMLRMQQIGLQAMAMYQPVASAFLNAARTMERGAQAASYAGYRGSMRGAHDANQEHVLAVGEEVLNVGTRMVPGKTTRVRRVVVEAPVQQDVTLHTETVVLERRKPVTTTGGDILTEVTVEMSDSSEVPVVSKSVRLVEEVLLRKEVTARTETIRDTVKRDKLEVEQPSQLPVVFNPATKQEEKRREERKAGEVSDKKQGFSGPHQDQKPGPQPDQKH
jgi:stress response protein YsnF